MGYFDFECRLPCKVFTPEEIQSTYGSAATRPIPAGYQPRRLSVRQRIEMQASKPKNKMWAVYAQFDGKRVFISSHHSDTAAENKANNLNLTLSSISDHVYIIGEREPGKARNETETE